MALNVTLAFPASKLTGLGVERFELTDAISELFELALWVTSTDPAIDMQDVVGESVLVTLNDEAFVPQVRGIVRAARQLTSEPTGISQYQLFVVPPLWLATRRRDHRIFRDLSVPEVVAAVAAGYGARIPPPIPLLSGDHDRREYTVQYGETDHDFILRLLAEEGISMFFDHAGGSAWTLVDDTTVFAPPLASPIPYVPPSSLSPAAALSPHASAVVITSHVETSASAIRDYDFEKPLFVLAAGAVPGGRTFANEASLEDYEFAAGRVNQQPDADARATRLLQEARARRRVLTCQTSFALAAGTRMAIANHPRADVVGDLLVVRSASVSQSRQSGAVTTHELECLDAAEPFRPRRRPTPRIAGTQTAFVVGAPGEEIDVDAYGRVQVEFRWDRRDLHVAGTSRRVRVSQAWAGAGFGLVLLPRVGDEVVISYVDGDPDEPLVVGRVHNAVATTPLSLPQEKTVSVWRSMSSPGGGGYNEILFEDAAGAELVSMRAQRDFQQEVLRNASTSIGNDHAMTVGGSSAVDVKGDQAHGVDGALAVRAAAGVTIETTSLDVTATARIHLTTPGERLDKSASHMVDANVLDLHARDLVQITAPMCLASCPDTIVLKVGGSSITLTPGGITIESTGVIDVKGSLIKLNS